MKKFKIAAALVISGLSLQAVAATYNYGISFSNQASVTGADTWTSSTSAATVASTNFGNIRTFNGTTTSAGASALSVSVSAWANTATGNKIESAYLARYDSNTELAVTSRETTANDEYATSSSRYNPNTSNSQHAMDNVGALESMLFSFSSAVTLTSITNGWPSGSSSLDTDISALVWTGAGLATGTDFNAASHLVGKTYEQLLTLGWVSVGSFGDVDPKATNSTGAGAVVAGTPVPVASTVSSRFWLIGADGLTGTKLDTNSDYAKLQAITVSVSTPRTPPPSTGVPEPESLALMGTAFAGMILVRRRQRV